MKYKVGDKVRIRKDLIVGEHYDNQGFVNSMSEFLGKETIIRKVLEEWKCYNLEIDNGRGCWNWTDDMLEPSTECDFKVGDKVIFNPADKDKLTGVFTVSEIDMGLDMPYIKLKEVKECIWFNPNRLFKVPLFKVGQIVQFKNVKDDKWYARTEDDDMCSLEDEFGVINEVNENHYVANKLNQDGCRYLVKDMKEGRTWSVTSASLQLVYAIEDARSIHKDDPGPKGDLGVIARDDSALAVAQAVDNVKGPQFKIGDKVIIRNDLVPGKEYIEWGGWTFLDEMAPYMGKVATITDYFIDDPMFWKLDIDNGEKSWIVNALLPYTPGSDYDLDKTIITNKQQTKQNYENRLQEKGPVIAGRERQSGCAVRYPGEQIRVGISNLGYRKVTCKR